MIATEVLIVTLLILLNGLFSMAEMAIVSARKNRLQERSEQGSSGAQTALQLAENPNRFLSTIQVGITLIGILSGAFGGATIAGQIQQNLMQYPTLRPYAAGIGVASVVLVITFFSLVFGELVPKRIALNNAEQLASRLAPVMNFLSKLSTPVVWLLSVATDLTLKLLRLRPSEEPVVTEEDVRSMISEGTRIGVFEETEEEMVSHVFRLTDRRISTMMTPRTQIDFIDIADPIEEVYATITQSPYSRFPVIGETADDVVGILVVKDLAVKLMQSEAFDLPSLLHQPLFVPEAMIAIEVLEKMREAGAEMALVIDEYGGLQGMVSLNDILVAIVGDVALPQTGEEGEVVEREDGSLLLDGQLLAEEVKELLDLDELPEEGKGYYETLGGLLMVALGRVPATGDACEWGGYRFEVVDMDGRRVDKVLAVKQDG